MNTKIIVATHKNYQMPKDTNLYLPVFVGKDLHPDVNDTFQGDNTGDNISAKNSTYNELTALYWGWKNLSADAVGLVHYRRHFSMGHKRSFDTILNQTQVDRLLRETDIILPKKRHYYIETNYSHYVHIHPAEPLTQTRAILAAKYPSYVPAFDKVLKQRSAHMFNMMIMKKAKYDAYCSWMFPILAELETKIDPSQYDAYNSRVYGFVSELLVDTWVYTNQLPYKEVNFVFMEKQNWFKKGGSFLKRKFFSSVK
ncbi:MAG TPA: exopolysaccharide biosynthesis protein [Lactobacillus sp.]|nr:exopolysaccharide biosynthesis protein [Lactobacillus sp.]